MIALLFGRVTTENCSTMFAWVGYKAIGGSPGIAAGAPGNASVSSPEKRKWFPHETGDGNLHVPDFLDLMMFFDEYIDIIYI